MERALVVVDDTDRHRELLHEAGELAAGVDAELVLLSTVTEDEFDDTLDAVESIARVENIGYSDSTGLEIVERFAREIGEDVLEDVDVEFDAVGAVVEEGEHANRIIRVAENRDCDHIFLTGRRRSPTGKAIFGDTAQSVILNFDDPVTVVTG
jgi:nucleotide-binding universal stress UspA family protein